MTYVDVREETDEKLHLGRDPPIKSWAILIGLIALGFGAAFYSNDYLLWKIAYISGAVFIGLSCMDDWEECVLDKSSRKVTVMRQTLVQRIFQTTNGARLTTGDLNEAMKVTVESEEVKYVGTGFLVAIHFVSGYSLGVTETATIGDKNDHELIAEKIHKFLDLDNKDRELVTPTLASPVEEDINGGENNISSSSDDDSFEQIDKADLLDGPPFDEQEPPAPDEQEIAPSEG